MVLLRPHSVWCFSHGSCQVTYCPSIHSVSLFSVCPSCWKQHSRHSTTVNEKAEADIQLSIQGQDLLVVYVRLYIKYHRTTVFEYGSVNMGKIRKSKHFPSKAHTAFLMYQFFVFQEDSVSLFFQVLHFFWHSAENTEGLFQIWCLLLYKHHRYWWQSKSSVCRVWM